MQKSTFQRYRFTNITVGAGYRFDGAVIDVFYMESLYEKRTVNNAILSGTYDNRARTLGVSAAYRF